MATITVNTSDTFEQWRVKTNSIGVTIEDYSNNISTKNVIATGNITASGNIIVTNVISGTSNIGNLTVSGNATLSGNISVTKDSYLQGNLVLGAGLGAGTNASAGNIKVGYYPLNFFTDNQLRVIIDKDGIVGMGTSSPNSYNGQVVIEKVSSGGAPIWLRHSQTDGNAGAILGTNNGAYGTQIRIGAGNSASTFANKFYIERYDGTTGATTTQLTIDNAGNATFTGNVITNDSFVGNGTVPAGSLLMWSVASAPAGYLLCDGSAVSRTTYKRLYDVIGTTFGNGNGSSTFNLPDYRNRMPIGAGSTYSVAGTGGSADATLVSHTHTGTTSDPGNFITGSAVTNLQGSGGSIMASASGAFSLTGEDSKAALAYNPGQSLPTTLNITAGSHTHSFTTAASGSSGTNANLPPYLGIYFIIKT